MAYSEKLAHRLREALLDLPDVEEKKMFRGVTFMVNDKMCICVSGDRLMCRIDPALNDTVIEMNGCHPMIMKGREYKGFVYVDEEAVKTKKAFDYWVGLCLDFNERAKASPRKKKKAPGKTPSKKTPPAKPTKKAATPASKASSAKTSPASKKASPAKKTRPPISRTPGRPPGRRAS